MKRIKYYVEFGISIFQGDRKVGELKFNDEDEMWEALKKLDEQDYKDQQYLRKNL